MAFWKIITVAFATSIVAEAKWYQHQKREATSNICDPVYNNTNHVQCYCVVDHTADIVRSASCHLTKREVQPDDASWNSFETLKNINKLTIANTRGIPLTYIPTKAMKLMQQLVKVDIKYGNIEKIDTWAFANLSLLEEITLSDNQIKGLEVMAFTNHRELTSIGLDTNNIVEIYRDVFVNLPSLEKLYFTNNKITTIHDKAFIHLMNLRELEIDRNSIFSLNSDTFSGLKNLQKLDLSGNFLEVIGDNTFLPLTSLKSLNLEQNNIQMLDERAFNGLSHLNALTLAHNKLTTIENAKTFHGLDSLSMLSLKSNQLTELKPQVMEPILTNFYHNASNLDVEDNNFPCDCRLDWFVKLINNTQSSHLKLATENLKCVPDSNLRDLWAKTEDTEKTGGQVFEDEESQVQNTDYEYYDETQLNGKLFYIDVRDLANCTNISRHQSVKKNDETKRIAVAVETTTKLTTKAISSPVTTPKPTPPTKNESILKTKASKDTIVVTTAKPKTDKISAMIKDNEMKNKETFTTVRLATVSAKPLEHNIYDQNMADEARPDKIKAHRSIQDDVKHNSHLNHNDACRNMNSVALVVMIISFRLYFY
ncbi:unnamed protein product [Chrysodeixis includens]|uniref:Connectin-like n=1 Tax=Chrysodeixis includens TaxID=689277 RepID=A0A9P0C1P9_CHRIL|nr:unnamed protein product [Chrysodeixis includens]